MSYGRNIVFLPRYNDHALYERLAGEPNTEVAPSGKVVPVADRPAYVHPRRSMSHLPAHGMLRRTSQHVAPQKGCNKWPDSRVVTTRWARAKGCERLPGNRRSASTSC